MNYKVIYVKSIPQRYIGMNFYAARELKIPFPHKKNVVLVLKGLNKDLTKSTIRHEKTEAELMRLRKYKYHKAHIIADETEEF